MITAHIPAGYMPGRSAGWSGAILRAAMAGAVFPDPELIAADILWLRAP